MAELTFKSPGVSTREIDLSGPSRVGPVGTPAGVIGTSAKGRAFVPLVFANLSEFVAEFGAVGPDKFGPMALREWLSNARAGLYLKVLGVGDGKARLQQVGSNSRGKDLPRGSVRNAGFIVGEEQVDPDNGRVSSNPYSGVERGAIQASVILGVASKDGAHGQTMGQTITFDDGQGTITSKKTYVFVESAVSDADTTATSHTPLSTGDALGANATVTGVKASIDDAITINGAADGDNVVFNVPDTANGTGGNITLQILDALPGSPSANTISIQRGSLTRDILRLAINGEDNAAIQYANAGGGQLNTGINGITAANGSDGNMVRLTLDRPGDHTVSITNGAGNLTQNPAADYFAAGGGAVTTGTQGHIAVSVASDADQKTVLASIRTAILGSTGHNGNITATAIADGEGDNRVTVLSQLAGGRDGNTRIVSDIANANILLGRTNASLGAINAAATENFFADGEDGHGAEGRTHFLSVLMKEVATASAKATITYTNQPSPGDTLILETTDGTTKQYVFVNPNATHTNGDILIVGDRLVAAGPQLAAGDSKVGGIAVNVDAGGDDATYAGLTALINSGKLSAAHTAGTNTLVITQDQPGRSGNRAITASVANSTIPATFTGGKGENIFTEAGSGKAEADGARYANVLRGVLMYPSGVVPSLVASRAAISNNVAVGQVGTKPNAKAKINFLNEVTAGNNGRITLTAADNSSQVYTSVNDAATPADGQYKRGDSGGSAAAKAALAATDFARAVNAAQAGKIFAHASGSQVTLSQLIGGKAGDKAIAPDPNFAASEATFDSHFEGGADSIPQLAGSTGAFEDNPTIAGIENGGSPLGKVDLTNGKQEFVMILNGHKSTSVYPNALTASFDPQSSNYLANVLNTDPTAMQKAGHYLYTYYDVFGTYATPMNTGNPYLTSAGQAGNDIAMLLPSIGARNAGTADKPNTENFSDRFRTAVSPTFVSQKFGGLNQPLFRIHSLDDGAQGNEVYKITIENLRRSQSDKNRYGTFDLLVRSFSDNDREQVVLEKFSALSLDPKSERFISRIIGDHRLFYDFDKRSGSQKLTLSGKFENNSKYIRVEVADEVEKGTMDPTALPFGFRGPQKLNIDNSKTFAAVDSTVVDAAGLAHESLIAPPIPLRRNLAVGEVPKKRVASSLNWGVQFEVDDLYLEPNKNSKPLDSKSSWTKYFPDFDQDDLSLISHRDGSAAADTYNNNKFTLENIQVVTTPEDNPDSSQWAAAEYRRTGVLDSSIVDVDGNSAAAKTRFLNTTSDLDLGSVRRYLKFNVFVAGGFDGVEIFDKEKAALSDVAVMREISDVISQGGKDGATAATFLKAIDVLTERSDVDIQLLAIPGIRQPLVADRAIDAVESRFDAMYIMDTVVYDSENTVVTGSNQKVSVTNTVSRFSNRVLDTSFAAAYFPDVILSDPSSGQNIQVPPSVPVLGAFSLNDQLAHPWFAPAGFTRGAMSNVAETQVKLNRDNLDSLYDADINPLTSFPHTDGVVVFGQKTLLRTQSSLDRVNVRRLLIELRRRVRRVANNFIFEPNREATLARFSAQVNPILRQIQQQQGVDRFLVKIDTTTTTQNDVENNTLRGKIFLQPTRSVEFISLDFVITNAGAEI